VGVASGLFIVLEGGDGAGKTTQLTRLAAALRQAVGREVVVTREPGGTGLGEQIRAALLHGGPVAPRAEALLYAADRSQHVEEVIRPVLARGGIAVSDRYLDSSIAYQVVGRGLDEADVRAINEFGSGGLRPDLTVLLDIAPQAGLERLSGAADRIEAAGLDFHARVNEHYRRLARRDPARYAVINAAGTPQAVHQAVWAAVLALPGLDGSEVGQ